MLCVCSLVCLVFLTLCLYITKLSSYFSFDLTSVINLYLFIPHLKCPYPLGNKHKRQSTSIGSTSFVLKLDSLLVLWKINTLLSMVLSQISMVISGSNVINASALITLNASRNTSLLESTCVLPWVLAVNIISNKDFFLIFNYLQYLFHCIFVFKFIFLYFS